MYKRQKIKKVQGELDLLNIQLGIKSEFSWDGEDSTKEDLAGKYADEDLEKNFLKNKRNSEEEEDELLDVFANKDGE